MAHDEPLPMTEAEWVARLKRSRAALKDWTHEAGLPWADKDLMVALVETEIGALKHFLPHMPTQLQPAVAPLVNDWDALLRALTG